METSNNVISLEEHQYLFLTLGSGNYTGNKTRGEKILGVANDPTCINIGRLRRTKPNLTHLKYDSRVNRHSIQFFGYGKIREWKHS